ncbi:hypothetical protein M8C21_025409 [Ambrosia artemisiifolia]|uniref:TF-B3 domain-containing protein n=1 Tax=Ambrosia artemisiifolia TaxID=4212 RepID=A0AAD5C5R8_AMBAR|nr:hypothetical protein M8C21_025409 [Ambrosia artemisiifolia]
MIQEWNKAVTTCDIKDGDFLIFELIADRSFNLKIVRKDIGQELTNTFHFAFLTLTKFMPLPYDHASHHFQNKDLDTPFLIRFGSAHEWLVRMENLLDDYYLTDGLHQMLKDLNIYKLEMD